ncbi:MAG: hypothetical protein ABIM89_05220 [Mycobacteriales bacterium]
MSDFWPTSEEDLNRNPLGKVLALFSLTRFRLILVLEAGKRATSRPEIGSTEADIVAANCVTAGQSQFSPAARRIPSAWVIGEQVHVPERKCDPLRSTALTRPNAPLTCSDAVRDVG